MRARIVQSGSFRTGIEKRTTASGNAIADYAATAGAFRAVVYKITPEMFPGAPERAAAAIWSAAKSADPPPRLMILGSDAYRRMGDKLALFQAAFAKNKDIAPMTDFPDAGPAVL
ncbi:hypothetical protein [Micromonospora zamorensis]|uniref:hypothetical protein n=1 Tax=Micromonospora zamorensis TaxID=709883 RepID=UPI003CF654B0